MLHRSTIRERVREAMSPSTNILAYEEAAVCYSFSRLRSDGSRRAGRAVLNGGGGCCIARGMDVGVGRHPRVIWRLLGSASALVFVGARQLERVLLRSMTKSDRSCSRLPAGFRNRREWIGAPRAPCASLQFCLFC